MRLFAYNGDLYCGDMDLDGMVILGRLRESLPATVSLAMNAEMYNTLAVFAVPGITGSRVADSAASPHRKRNTPAF